MLTHAATGAACSRTRHAWVILVCAVILAGCGPRRPEAPVPPPSVAAPAAPASAVPPGVTRYAIDPARSVVTLRVYRAGRLASLGHNHVITSSEEAGSAWTNGELAASGFEVRLRVAELVIDDPAARAAAGPEFPGEVSEAARDGTRHNMLRPEVLDGDRYPEIVVRADALEGSWDQPRAAARITLRDQTRTIEVPLAIEREAGALTARGAFRILQSDFGITPFSIGGGALQVADGVDVAFEVRAVAQ